MKKKIVAKNDIFDEILNGSKSSFDVPQDFKRVTSLFEALRGLEVPGDKVNIDNVLKVRSKALHEGVAHRKMPFLVPVAALGAILLGIVLTAFTGNLPSSMQSVAANLFSKVGISVPVPTTLPPSSAIYKVCESQGNVSQSDLIPAVSYLDSKAKAANLTLTQLCSKFYSSTTNATPQRSSGNSVTANSTNGRSASSNPPGQGTTHSSIPGQGTSTSNPGKGSTNSSRPATSNPGKGSTNSSGPATSNPGKGSTNSSRPATSNPGKG